MNIIKDINFVVFTVINECITIITDYKTLVSYVLPRIQLDTIKVKELKDLQDINYIKRTQNL